MKGTAKEWGEAADHEEATESLDIAARLRAKLRALLGLSN
jgi:hypothetical protein